MITTPIATRTETREALFTRLYELCFPALARYTAETGGDLDEARDAFQEALLIYYEKVLIGGFEPQGGHEGYLLGIARNVLRKTRERQLPTRPLEQLELREEEWREPAGERIMSYLRVAGKKCMDLLSAFYYEKLSMKELAERFGFRSERSATVQKYKCLEKVRETVREKSLEYEDFID